LLEELVAVSSLEAQAHASEVRFAGAPPVTVQGDPELLRRAIENVIRNAIRHAPAGTAVEAALEAANGQAKVLIRDYGPGVPEEALPRIFDAFYRVESDRDRASGGAGLGLSIARRAVELHQGVITARNAQPGLLVEIDLPESPHPSV
jgi:signal transduction histidine kinase